MKIRICIPLYCGGIRSDVRKGVTMLRESGIAEFELKTASGTYIYENRNAMVNLCRSDKIRQELVDAPDKYLFIDNDVTGFTPDLVQKMITLNKPIVGAAYRFKENLADFVACYFDIGVPMLISKFVPSTATGITMVDGIGMGFTLIDSKVFKDMDYPWFEHVTIRHEDRASVVGEDFLFCAKAKNLGFSTYCMCDSKLIHTLQNIA